MAYRTSTRSFGLGALAGRFQLSRGMIFGIMIIGALFAFEMFNYSTTEFALADLLGETAFMGIKWSTILALAFCGIDFAGIARLFTPEEGVNEPAEVWYLFGAWLLAATMNAMLTWWGVSIAILGHDTLGNAVIAREMLLKVVPVFVAVLVWLSRVLIIGTFSAAGDRLFSQMSQARSYGGRSQSSTLEHKLPVVNPAQTGLSRQRAPQASYRSAPKPEPSESLFDEQPSLNPRPEPTYHPIGMRSRTPSNSGGNSAAHSIHSPGSFR